MQDSIYSPTETIKAIESRLGRKFAFTRFGDGELMLMDGWVGKEGNHYASKGLQRELIEAFQIQHEDYLVSLAGGNTIEDDTLRESNLYKGIFGAFSIEHNERIAVLARKYGNRKKYYRVNLFSYLAIYHPERFLKFTEILKRDRKVTLVGGKHLLRNKWIKKIFGVDTWVAAPSKQAYRVMDKIEEKTRGLDTDVVIIGLGCATGVLQKRLWDKDVVTIDMGSILDGLAGYRTRSWMAPAQNNIIRLWEMIS